jgi:hypothetical protein
MTGRETPRGPDPDDWFAGPDRPASRRDRSGARTVSTTTVEDDWMDDDDGARRGDSGLLASLSEGWVALAAGAAVVLVLLLGGLALAGVFSSSKPKPTVTTIPTLPTTAPTTTTAPAVVVPAPTTTLKPGDTGAQVKVLQRALTHLGYSVGTIDGDYGAATTAAVKQFQTASNLTADGLFGPATKTALTTALNAG